MTTWARTVENAQWDTSVTPPVEKTVLSTIDVTNTNPVDIYNPEIAEQFIAVPDGTENYATWSGSAWVNPLPPAPAPMAFVPQTVSAVAFRNLFSIHEEIYISGSSDPVVKTFWSRFTDPKLDNVNMALPTVSSALTYLSATHVQPEVTPPVTYLAAGRMDQILHNEAPAN